MDGWQTQLLATPAVAIERQYALTVLLPAYNEENAIEGVLEEIVDVLSATDTSYEIVVVDDASTDRTAERAQAFAEACWQCPVRVIHMTANRGAGAARKVGVRAARKHIDWYLEAANVPVDRAIRKQLLESQTPAEVIDLIESIFSGEMREAA